MPKHRSVKGNRAQPFAASKRIEDLSLGIRPTASHFGTPPKINLVTMENQLPEFAILKLEGGRSGNFRRPPFLLPRKYLPGDASEAGSLKLQLDLRDRDR